jgi:hypothetical protein
MTITLCRSNIDLALGLPAIETFELTPAQLRAWNKRASAGLPSITAQAWLQSLAESRFDSSAPLSWADIKNALG